MFPTPDKATPRAGGLDNDSKAVRNADGSRIPFVWAVANSRIDRRRRGQHAHPDEVPRFWEMSYK